MVIGIDTVEIQRFQQWYLKPSHQLRRILSDQEITYCLENKTLSAQRFAVRFAVREAFYKALSQLLPLVPAYLTVCKAISVEHHFRGFPYLLINRGLLKIKKIETSISLTHSQTSATAVVLLTRLKK